MPSNIDITFGNKDVARRGPVRTMGYLELGKDQLEPLLYDQIYVVSLHILSQMHALVELLAETSQLKSGLRGIFDEVVRISLSHKVLSVKCVNEETSEIKHLGV